MIAIEDIQFPVSATRSSLTMTSPASIATSPAHTPPRPASLPAVLLSTPKFFDHDLTKLPSLPRASVSRKRKGASRRPKAVETRRTHVRTKLRGVAQAATKSKSLKIKIPKKRVAKRLRTSSRINIDALPPSAISPASPHLGDPPQKLTITIPAITRMADSKTPFVAETPAASASQAYPVSFKIRIPPLIRLPNDDQNVHPDVSGPDNTERPSQASPGGRPRRIAPLPKRYRQGV